MHKHFIGLTLYEKILHNATLIGCTESFLYKIAYNPWKGVLYISEVKQPLPELCLIIIKLSVSNNFDKF